MVMLGILLVVRLKSSMVIEYFVLATQMKLYNILACVISTERFLGLVFEQQEQAPIIFREAFVF